MAQRILVVDDHPGSVLVMRTMLEAQGYDILSAADGIEALECLRANCVDLVLLDIMMPRMNGLEALQRIKGDAATAHLPVIMVTAKAQDHDIIGGYRFGADYYLTKPFTAQQLRYGVDMFLGAQGAS